jgi:hypothetical protein
MDARKMEAQLARLNKSAENAGITTNLRSILQMFRDYIATLDEAIKLAKLQDANPLGLRGYDHLRTLQKSRKPLGRLQTVGV